MSLNLIYVVAFRGVEIFKTKNKSVALELCEKKKKNVISVEKVLRIMNYLCMQ